LLVRGVTMFFTITVAEKGQEPRTHPLLRKGLATRGHEGAQSGRSREKTSRLTCSAMTRIVS
jgi:hypothetical protein